MVRTRQGQRGAARPRTSRPAKHRARSAPWRGPRRAALRHRSGFVYRRRRGRKGACEANQTRTSALRVPGPAGGVKGFLRFGRVRAGLSPTRPFCRKLPWGILFRSMVALPDKDAPYPDDAGNDAVESERRTTRVSGRRSTPALPPGASPGSPAGLGQSASGRRPTCVKLLADSYCEAEERLRARERSG